MELRVDRLLEKLRADPQAVLRAIDADPLLGKREAGGLVIANASKRLFTPQAEHQLYAKGIVYRRDPYRLVSLPLIKIYNLGEKEFQPADLAALAAQSGAQIRFLRKLDGSMIQRFADGGRVRFSTRGMLEGLDPAAALDDEDAPDRLANFDYVGAAREIAAAKYPLLLDPHWAPFFPTTLIFELIHPEARIITNYGDRRDLVLLAAFDLAECRYLPYGELAALAAENSLTVADALTPAGGTLAGQIDDLLRGLAGTDQEGAVIVLENGREVTYRAKVKSADYLKLFRLMVRCSYRATAEMLDAFAEVPLWEDFERQLQSLGSESVPEEFLGEYRKYHAQYAAEAEACRRSAAEIETQTADILKGLEGVADPRERRKLFAKRVSSDPRRALYFRAYDGSLDWRAVRESGGYLPNGEK